MNVLGLCPGGADFGFYIFYIRKNQDRGNWQQFGAPSNCGQNMSKAG
jgi:hypothetical protein